MRKTTPSLLPTLLVALAVGGASSPADAANLRSATASEIVDYVGKHSNLTQLSNGWQYKSTNKYGYKFLDGRMCVRSQSGAVSCTKIVTDGEKFYMMDSSGSRTAFK